MPGDQAMMAGGMPGMAGAAAPGGAGAAQQAAAQPAMQHAARRNTSASTTQAAAQTTATTAQTTTSSTTGRTTGSAAVQPLGQRGQLTPVSQRGITEERKLASETRKEAQPVDLSVEDLRARGDLLVGKKAEIEVSVKNNSDIDIRDCGVVFKSEDGFTDKKTVSLRGKGKERLKFDWTPKKDGRQRITATVEYKDDSNPRNNEVSETVEVKKEEQVDLSVKELRVPREAYVGKPADIEVIIANETNTDVKECIVRIESEDGMRDKTRIALRPRSQERARFTWTPRRDGRQTIKASIECREDMNSRNNEASQPVMVIGESSRGGKEASSSKLPRDKMGMAREEIPER
jgi:hypothetical protein